MRPAKRPRQAARAASWLCRRLSDDGKRSAAPLKRRGYEGRIRSKKVTG